MEKYGKLSLNYHQLPTPSVSLYLLSCEKGLSFILYKVIKQLYFSLGCCPLRNLLLFQLLRQSLLGIRDICFNIVRDSWAWFFLWGWHAAFFRLAFGNSLSFLKTDTVNYLNIRTPKKLVVITLKF